MNSEERLDSEAGTRRRVENSPLQFFTLRKITSTGERGSSLNSLPKENSVKYVKGKNGPDEEL